MLPLVGEDRRRQPVGVRDVVHELQQVAFGRRRVADGQRAAGRVVDVRDRPGRGGEDGLEDAVGILVDGHRTQAEADLGIARRERLAADTRQLARGQGGEVGEDP